MTGNANRWTTVLQVLALVLLAPAEADAACVWAPPSGELFTVPADGATGVPTDARLWALVGLEGEVTVTLDGAALEEKKEGWAWRSYTLPSLEAGKVYSYSVSICHVEGCSETFNYGPYSFTAGDEPAEPPAVPELVEVTAQPTDASLSPEAGEGSCDHQILAQECYDVFPLLHYRFKVKQDPNASHYAIWAGEEKTGSPFFISTADCPVQIVAHCSPPEDSDECDPASANACFNVMAYNEAGQSTVPVEMCIGEPPVGGEPAEADIGGGDVAADVGAGTTDEGKAEAGSGCGVSAGPSASAGVLLLGILAVLVLLGRRKTAGKNLTSALLLLLSMLVASCDSSKSESIPDATVGPEPQEDTAPVGDCQGVFDSEEPPLVIAAVRVCLSQMVWYPASFACLHGKTAAYLYSDGSLVYRNPKEEEPGPTLPFRKVQLSDPHYCDLMMEVSPAGLEQEAGSGTIALTEATDLPDTEVFLSSDEEDILVSMYGDLFDFEEEYMAEDYESLAPNAIALARGLEKLSTGGEILESESIHVAAAILTEDHDSQNCPLAGAVEWPFADVPLADHAYEWESAGGVGLLLTGQQATEVRNWWVAEVESPPCSRVFVDIDGTAYEVVLAEVPPGGPDALPFQPCLGEGW